MKAVGTNAEPGSPDVIDALNKLECSGRFPEEVIRTAKNLWRKAHMVFNQSEWAYKPQSKEAQEFILAAAAVRNDLERT